MSLSAEGRRLNYNITHNATRPLATPLARIGWVQQVGLLLWGFSCPASLILYDRSSVDFTVRQQAQFWPCRTPAVWRLCDDKVPFSRRAQRELRVNDRWHHEKASGKCMGSGLIPPFSAWMTPHKLAACWQRLWVDMSADCWYKSSFCAGAWSGQLPAHCQHVLITRTPWLPLTKCSILSFASCVICMSVFWCHSIGPSIAPVCSSQPHRPYSGTRNRHYSALGHTG